jgi:hypothetical protein
VIGILNQKVEMIQPFASLKIPILEPLQEFLVVELRVRLTTFEDICI